MTVPGGILKTQSSRRKTRGGTRPRGNLKLLIQSGMRHFSILSLLLFVVGALATCSSQNNEPIVITTDRLITDIPFLRKQIVDTHPNPFHLADRAEFDAALDALVANDAGYDADQMLVRLLEVVASIGDGHTNLRPFSYYAQYPIRFYWRQDHVFVSGTLRGNEDLLGSRLVAINGTPIDEVARRIFRIIPGNESPGFTRDWATYYFTLAQIMYGAGIATDRNEITYTLDSGNGQVLEVRLSVVPDDLQTDIIRPYDSPPHFHEAKEHGLWFEPLGDGLVYLHFSQYPRERVVKRVAKELNKVLEQGDVHQLLVDLRRNGGGNFNRGRTLIEIIERTVRKNNIEVYVATSSATYSAAVANAADFKQRLDATLIGETTGGRPNGYQESMPFVLPRTRIPGSTSGKYYTFQEADTEGIHPDIRIDYTWEHYASAADPILDYLANN